MDSERMTADRANDSIERMAPLLNPALVSCLSNSVTEAVDENGNFDDEKFQLAIKKCVENVYVGGGRVTVGKAAAIAQALFFAMFN